MNNARVGWSYVGIASMTVSIYAIISTAYKYGIKSLKKARRHGEKTPRRRGEARNVLTNSVNGMPDDHDHQLRRVPTIVGGAVVERYAVSSDEDDEEQQHPRRGRLPVPQAEHAV